METSKNGTNLPKRKSKTAEKKAKVETQGLKLGWEEKKCLWQMNEKQ